MIFNIVNSLIGKEKIFKKGEKCKYDKIINSQSCTDESFFQQNKDTEYEI